MRTNPLSQSSPAPGEIQIRARQAIQQAGGVELTSEDETRLSNDLLDDVGSHGDVQSVLHGLQSLAPQKVAQNQAAQPKNEQTVTWTPKTGTGDSVEGGGSIGTLQITEHGSSPSSSRKPKGGDPLSSATQSVFSQMEAQGLHVDSQIGGGGGAGGERTVAQGEVTSKCGGTGKTDWVKGAGQIRMGDQIRHYTKQDNTPDSASTGFQKTAAPTP